MTDDLRAAIHRLLWQWEQLTADEFGNPIRFDGLREELLELFETELSRRVRE